MSKSPIIGAKIVFFRNERFRVEIFDQGPIGEDRCPLVYPIQCKNLKGFPALEMKPEWRMIHETDLFAEMIIRVWLVDPDFLKQFVWKRYQFSTTKY